MSGILNVKSLANDETTTTEDFSFLLLFILVLFGNAIGFMTLSSVMNFPIYWRSSLLSNIFFIGYTIAKQNAFISINGLGYYMMAMSFFHLSEYVFTALFNLKQVSTDSFLLNHSLEYGLAAMASWFEYLLELYFIPSIKTALITRILGLLLVMFGETFRKMAMYTAGTNFNHYVQETKQQDHELVTSGIYSLVRHPSYFGWFYWSIGTQLLLANPICLVAYTVTSWKFFNSRIVYEEYFLRKFFGKKYVEYQKKVTIGIPFIKGYLVDEESLD
jgi:protein-S-isoprenylcysteine O-methyltransferase